MSGEIKKHRNDALASGVIIGYGIGLFTNLAVLLVLKEALTSFWFELSESAFNEILTLITIGGIISIAIGLAYEIHKKQNLEPKHKEGRLSSSLRTGKLSSKK